MRVAYLDCVGGMAGDMLLGALVDAGLPLADLRADVQALGLDGLDVAAETVRRNSIRATLVRVTVNGEPADLHRTPEKRPEAMCAIIDRAAALPDGVRERAQAVVRRLGAAEAAVHGHDPHQVHFHEVGAWDTLADAVGTVAGLHRLGIEQLVSSPVPTGRGTVQTAHGPLPVPPPAALELLRGIPVLDPPVEAELCTPTGAALVATLCDGHGARPPMTVETTGYGAGTAEPAGVTNVVRLLIGESRVPAGLHHDPVVVLETTIDDMTGEAIGHLADACRAAGALDVTLQPVQMKKNRPGVVLQALVHEGERAAVEDALFRESSTFGVRYWYADRDVLAREIVTVATDFGSIRVKIGRRGDEVVRVAPEHDDVAAAATAHGAPLADVRAAAEAAARARL